MNLIELNILQSFPVTCLNRDDLGAPKTAYYGGCQRARVSSQSWKRAIRTLVKEQSGDYFSGQRTRFLIRELLKIYQQHDLTENQANQLSVATAESLGKVDSLEKGKVKTLLYFSPMELAQVVSSVLDADPLPVLAILNDDTQKKKDKAAAEKKLKKNITDKAVKKLKSRVKDNADIAIFGRMVADNHSLMVEGAGLFSHALSTHVTNNEIDFFSAVDDKNILGDEGAGHIGTLEYNSACYYRYVGLNLDLLDDPDHLAHFEPAEKKQVITSFLKAAIMAVPVARKNSMFGFNPPAYVMGLRRSGQPMSLINAFETPVESAQGYVEKSIAAMKAHWENLNTVYGLQTDDTVLTYLPEKNLDTFIQDIC